MKVVKIRQKNSGFFSTAGNRDWIPDWKSNKVGWTVKGKTWSSVGKAKSHIVANEEYYRELTAEIEIIEFDFENKSEKCYTIDQVVNWGTDLYEKRHKQECLLLLKKALNKIDLEGARLQGIIADIQKGIRYEKYQLG